jgi:hypothetical protein
MSQLVTALIVLLVSASVTLSGILKENEAEFFAGMTLLQQKTDLKPEEKAEKFRELEALTGISAADAEKILKQYRDKPEEWQKFYGSMMKFLNDTKLAVKKSDSVRTAAQDTSKKTIHKNDSLRTALRDSVKKTVQKKGGAVPASNAKQ